MALTKEFNPMFTIISRNNCLYCLKAKELLSGNGIFYKEFNIEETEHKWLLDLVRKAGIKTVPQIYDMSGRYVGGYTELKDLIDNLEG